MAADGAPSRTPEEVRRHIEHEREELAKAVDALREDIGEAADVAGKLRSNLPLVAAAALGLGFVAAGGIGATARLLFRRSRDAEEKLRVGRFALVDRD
jgi:hypothetical protein